jgi:hypothetical protein
VVDATQAAIAVATAEPQVIPPEHSTPHFADGVCNCECALCSYRPNPYIYQCICPGCNPAACGLHE